MSRLGKKPIAIPSGVTVSLNGRMVTVAKGDKTLQYEHRLEVCVTWDEQEKNIVVSANEAVPQNKQVGAYWGMTRALLANMVVGVTKGYERKLEVVGTGYTAKLAGASLDLKVGFANTISVPIPAGVDVNVERSMITVKGTDKQAVGQFAAEVRAKRKPEPYNGKGIKYVGEVVRRKQGKAFGS